jgi:hypothetical protein
MRGSPVDRSLSSFLHLKGNCGFPVTLHIHHCRSVDGGEIAGEAAEMRLPVASIFAFSINVMDDHAEADTQVRTLVGTPVQYGAA